MSDVIKTEKAKTGDIQLIKYDDIKNQSTEEYFNENQFSIDAFKKKYALTDNETYVQALKRVCDYVASVEKTDELKKYWSERWFDEIYKDFWKPAGSIMQGAGSGKNISLSNCTTISLGALKDDEEWDNLESIIKNTSYEVAKTGAYRQGLGVDFSRLRPTGLKLENSAKMSTGPIHWMQFIDSISYYVGQNGRRVAQLFSLNIAHPDIENFITVKSDYTKIQNANISVQVTNDFYAAVTKDKEWEMVFEIPSVKKGDKIYVDVHSTDMDCKFDKEAKKWYKIAARDRKYEKISKKVPARKLLELIAKNMHSHAEPGILNIDTIRKYSNSDAVYDEKDEYDSRIISTNPCAEQALSRSSLCVLSSINCEKFSSLKEVYIKQLEKIAKSINRFLDNVNECELVYQTFAVPHQRLAMEKLRRIGAGYTNLAGWLFKKNLNYDSEEAKLAAAEFTKWYCYWLYVSGEELGKEKGDFGLFDKNKWKDALFVSRIIEESKVLNKEYNVPVLTGNHSRNCTYISLAPTGTISTQFRNMVLSYGIEPAFFTHYWKRTRMNNATYEYYFCVPKIVRDAFDKAGVHIPMESDTIKDDWKGSTGKQISKFIDDNKDKVGFKFKSATNIDHLDKLNLMCDVAKWVDSSISTTYLLNEKSNWKDVYNFILEAHKKDLKAIAAFPDKKMYGIVSSIPFRDLAVKLKTDGVEIHHQNFSDDELKELNLSRENVVIQRTHAPKRLDVLDADIYVVTVKNEKYCVVIGMQNSSPFEVFAGKLNGLSIKINNVKQGKIIRVKRGQYALEFDDIYIEDFSKQFNPVEQILFRMCSMSLQWGVPIIDIVEQLQKSTDDITSLTSAAARILKKYIKNGEKANGQHCPSCGNQLIYTNGCTSCISCGFSKCS